jgi:hypothetical protein
MALVVCREEGGVTPRTATAKALTAALRDGALEFTSREAMAEFVIAQLTAALAAARCVALGQRP